MKKKKKKKKKEGEEISNHNFEYVFASIIFLSRREGQN